MSDFFVTNLFVYLSHHIVQCKRFGIPEINTEQILNPFINLYRTRIISLLKMKNYIFKKYILQEIQH